MCNKAEDCGKELISILFSLVRACNCLLGVRSLSIDTSANCCDSIWLDFAPGNADWTTSPRFCGRIHGKKPSLNPHSWISKPFQVICIWALYFIRIITRYKIIVGMSFVISRTPVRCAHNYGSRLESLQPRLYPSDAFKSTFWASIGSTWMSVAINFTQPNLWLPIRHNTSTKRLITSYVPVLR